MSDTPNGKPPDPKWWSDDAPPKDEFRPPTNVTTLPTAAPFPPMPPAPPPPPPPPPAADTPGSDVVPAGRPPADRIRNVRGAAQRHRRWIAVAGAVILVVVLVNRWSAGLADKVGRGVSSPLVEHNDRLAEMVATIAAAKNQPSTVTVSQPLAWLNCPVTQDAATMIGYDPATNYATLDPERAARVESQVRALVVGNPLTALRIMADSPTSLTVTVGGTKGVNLVDCTAGAMPPKQGGEAATVPTTAAPR